MANGVNKAIVIGNLARDAELTHVGENETPKCTFRLLATTRKGQDDEHTEGFNCVVWGKRAEALVEYLTLGKRLYVEGEIRTRSYEDDDGERRYFTELHVRDLVFQPQPRSGDTAGALLEEYGEIPY
jgi:single-strand DNA-binding protein